MEDTNITKHGEENEEVQYSTSLPSYMTTSEHKTKYNPTKYTTIKITHKP